MINSALMNPSYIQQILTCFAEIDIEKLRFYLKDEYSYQNATREIFLSKLADIFVKARIAGDTEFLIFTGACADDESDDFNKRGYCFVGMKSKHRISFIFVEEGDDIKDVIYCPWFETDEEIEDMPSFGRIWINHDERFDFIQTPEYLAKVAAAQSAYDEIITSPAESIDRDFSIYWLKKHSELYNRLGGYDVFMNTMKWSKFTRLYSILSRTIANVNDHGSGVIEVDGDLFKLRKM